MEGLSFSAARKLIASWHQGTFPTVASSVRYHHQKHVISAGRTESISQYTEDAVQFYKQNKEHSERVTLRDGKAGVRIRALEGGPGGLFTREGKIVTFWYE